MKLISIGYGNSISTNRIISINPYDSAPMKRLVATARKFGVCIDATMGHRTRTVIITDSDHVILSAVQSDTLMERVQKALGV